MQEKKTTRQRPRGRWHEWGKVENELRNWISNHGHFPTNRDLDRTGYCALRGAIVTRHGGIPAVRQRMGYAKMVPTDEEFSADLRAAAARIGCHTLAVKEYDRYGTFGSKRIRKRFGTWNRALVAAGLIISHERGIPDETLYADLKKVTNDLGGRSITCAEYDRHGRYCSATFRRFGVSWEVILARVGVSHSHGLADQKTKPSPRQEPRTLEATARETADSATRSRGIPRIKVEPRKWSPERIEVDYLMVYEKLGKSPTAVSLRQLGLDRLTAAIAKYYPGGIHALRQKFGHKDPYRRRGYLCEPSNIENEYKELAKQLGHAPTYREIQKQYPRLAAAIIEWYPGKTNGLLQKLGYPIRFKKLPIRKGEVHITTIDGIEFLRNLEREYRRISEKLGHPAKFAELRSLGRVDLAQAIIDRYPGKYMKMRQTLGMPLGARPYRYWSVARIEEEYRALVEQFGHPPTPKELGKYFPKLFSAVHRNYPGGMTVLMRKYGASPARRRKYWTPETIEKEYHILVLRIGHNPSASELNELDAGLAQAVSQKYPGGMHGLRDKLGMPQVSVPKNHWCSWENLKARLRQWLVEYGPPLTYRRLQETGGSSLKAAIAKYHGGFSAVRVRMGYGPVTSEMLKDHADSLVRILFALQVERPALTSDALWCAIMAHWTEVDLKAGLTAFTDHGDLTAFRSLLSR